ncbi:MAG: methylenetetrahydrofolate reductase [Planctomycetota bacterium]|jgi:5,10-methylenetetrahydrofolate reductase
MGHWLHGDTTILEFVPPPRRRGAEGLERRLRRLERELEGFPFDAVNIPEIREEESRSTGGERVSPFEPRFSGPEIAAEIGRRFALPTIVNHVVTARPRRDLILWLREAHERHGVENFVLVGPARRTDPRPGPPVPEANEIAKGILPTSVRIGNICIPGRISAEVEESERMEGKARGGVDFFTSQILYHATPFIDLLRALAERSPAAGRAPLLVSLCPLRSPASIGFLRWLGVELDERTASELTRDPDRTLERSIEHLTRVWSRIRAGAEDLRSANPLGLNIAPVGPMPRSATLHLARSTRAVAREV